MQDWKTSQIYCRKCGRWHNNIQHRDCPYSPSESRLWINIRNLEMGCSRCNQTWALEDNIFYCSCGNIQQTEYTDSLVVLEEGDEIIASDDDLVYVLTRSGTVVVGYRSFDDFSYGQ